MTSAALHARENASMPPRERQGRLGLIGKAGISKEEYPWFWDGGTFKGERENDVHLPITQKQAARTQAKQE